MNEGAANLVDQVLPEVPVLTMPHPLRFPLAFDGRLLAAVLRIFVDTVARWYRDRQAERGLPGGHCRAQKGPVRCNAHALSGASPPTTAPIPGRSA
jgi:hypothetical protein